MWVGQFRRFLCKSTKVALQHISIDYSQYLYLKKQHSELTNDTSDTVDTGNTQ